MPTIDMPLKELKNYYGSTPKPEDFDDFWDAGIAEMKTMVPSFELIPSSFQVPHAECFDLWFTGVGGSRVYAKYARPKHVPAPIPAVLQFHGYSGDSTDWSDKLGYVAMGYAIAVMDCRGQAGKSQDLGSVSGNTFYGHIIRGLDDEPEKMLFRNIFLDTAQLANIVMSLDEIDETKVSAFGFSQGGGLAAACAALEPKIYRVAPVYPFLSDYKRIWDMDLDVDAYKEIREYFRRNDPLHERETEIFTKLGYIDIQNLASRITADVLWVTGLMDEICPPSSQFAAYNKITAPKEMLIYPDFGHEAMKGVTDKIMLFMAEM